MKSKRSQQMLLLLGTVLLAALLLTRPQIRSAWNGRQLQRNLLALAAEGRTVCTLNEAAPFPWDAVYTFDPYTGRAEIEEAIGFSDAAIRESFSEGQLQLLFVRGSRVQASICGYPDQLGYRVAFSGKITWEEHRRFAVTEENGLAVLTAEPPA